MRGIFSWVGRGGESADIDILIGRMKYLEILEVGALDQK
jgi:hypothetical protein